MNTLVIKRAVLLCFCTVALCLRHAAVAVQVTSSGPQTLKQPQGQSVSLGCTYTLTSTDTGALDVEWTRVSQDMTSKDQMLLSYTGGEVFQLGPPELMRRFLFTSDPGGGDASVNISGLRGSDTATYQCRVKKTPGIDSRKLTLVVLVPPSRPRCWVDGGEVKGSSVSLRCQSSHGSSPLTYSWSREGGNLPLSATQNAQTGEMLITNHSSSYTGLYVCTASNDVGTERCSLRLHAYNPTNQAGVIAGAVIGSLLLLLLLLLLIWLLIRCCCCKERFEKDVANDIREDAPAPESRPASRAASFRSFVNYHTHSGVNFSAVRSSSTRSSEKSRARREEQMLAAESRAAPRYDSRYGFAV